MFSAFANPLARLWVGPIRRQVGPKSNIRNCGGGDPTCIVRSVLAKGGVDGPVMILGGWIAGAADQVNCAEGVIVPFSDLMPLIVWERIVIAVALSCQADRICAGSEGVEEVLLVVKLSC